MTRWLPRVLTRVRALAMARQIVFTLKAQRELAGLSLGLDVEDACDVLANLVAGDSAGRLASAATGEWMYLFTPRLGATVIYVKLILRNACVVVSFHEDEIARGEEDA